MKINIPVQIYLAIFIGYFFLRNIFMPLCYDDYAYAFIWDGEHGGNLDAMQIENSQRVRVQSFADILTSQWSHYFTWGGRIIGHTLAQFFLWIGKPYFDIVNIIVMIIFFLTILKLSNLKFRDSKFAMVWIFFNLFVVGANFGETIIWMTWLTGTCNYFWPAVFQLIFLLQYVNAIRAEKKSPPSPINPLPYFIAGIIAGWATEAGSLATIFLTGIFIIRAYNKKILQTWMLAGLSGAILGCSLNILSPGNFAQLEFIQSVNPHFKFSAELFFYHIHHAFLPIILIDLFALLPAIFYFIKRGLNFFMVSFAAAGFLVPCAMLFSPKFEMRITIISLIFILVSSTMAIAKLKIVYKKFCATVTAISVLYFLVAIDVTFSLYSETDLQLEYLNRHKTEDLIVMPKFNSSQTIISFAGIANNENYCINIMVAQYYGVKKILGGN